MDDKKHVLVPGGGLEPPHHRWRRILSPLRLPIPPSRHAAWEMSVLVPTFDESS